MKTISLKTLQQGRKKRARQEPCSLDSERPKTRGDCASVPRPCPFYACRHNLGVHITRRGGLKLHVDEDGAPSTRPSCALDIAEQGEHTVEDIASIFRVHAVIIRKAVRDALAKLSSGLDEGTMDHDKGGGAPNYAVAVNYQSAKELGV